MAVYRAPEQDLAWYQKLGRYFSRPDAEIRNIVKLSSESSAKVDQIQSAYNRLAYEHLDVVNAIIKLWDHRTTVAFNRNSGFISSNKDQNHWVSQTDQDLLEGVQEKIAVTVRSLSGGADSDLKAFRCFQRTLTETTRMLDLGYKANLGGASKLERSVKDMVESGLIFHVDQEDAAPQNLVGIFTKNAIRLVGDRGREHISLETGHQVHLLDDKVQEHAHLELDAKLDFAGVKAPSNQQISQRYLGSLRSRVTAALDQAGNTVLDAALITPENAAEIGQAVEAGKQAAIDELLQDQGTQERLDAAVSEAQRRAVAAIVPAVGDEATEEEISAAQRQATRPAVQAFRELLARENPEKVERFQELLRQRCIAGIREDNSREIARAQHEAFERVVDAAVGALHEELRGVFTQDYLRSELLGALQGYSEAQKDHFAQAVHGKEVELGGNPEAADEIGAVAELADLERQKGVLEQLIANFDAHVRYAQNMLLLAAGSDRLPRNFDPYAHFPPYIHGQKAVGHLADYPKDAVFLPDDPGFVPVAGGADEAPELGVLDALARDRDCYLIPNYQDRLQGRVEMAKQALLFSTMQESAIRTKLVQVAHQHKRVRGSGAILKAQVDQIGDEIDASVEKVKACRTALTKARVDQARFAPEEYSPDNPELYDFTLGFSDEEKAAIRDAMGRHSQHFVTLRRNAYAQLGSSDLARRGIYRPNTILTAIHEKEQQIERLQLEHETSEKTAEDFLLVERFSEEHGQVYSRAAIQEYEDKSRIRVAEKAQQARLADIQAIRERHHEHELVSAGRLGAGMPLRGREMSLGSPSRSPRHSSRFRSLARPTPLFTGSDLDEDVDELTLSPTSVAFGGSSRPFGKGRSFVASGGLSLTSDSDDESPRPRLSRRRRSVTSPRSPVSSGLTSRLPETRHGLPVSGLGHQDLEREEAELKRPRGRRRVTGMPLASQTLLQPRPSHLQRTRRANALKIQDRKSRMKARLQRIRRETSSTGREVLSPGGRKYERKSREDD